MNKVDPCVHCGESTAFGSGRFVNRISSDCENGNFGFACADCSGYDCDRCNKPIYLDCEITPEQCFGEDANDFFKDGNRHICEDCLTNDELKAFEALNEVKL